MVFLSTFYGSLAFLACYIVSNGLLGSGLTLSTNGADLRKEAASIATWSLCDDGTAFPCRNGERSMLVDSEQQSMSLGAAAGLRTLPSHLNSRTTHHQSGLTQASAAPAAGSEGGTLPYGSHWVTNKPMGDIRHYAHATLPNGLQVLNVHDDSANMVSLGVAVEAGSYYDPPEHRGRAHLTEHSLFLGSRNYTSHTGLDEFLATHGGSSNAFTSEETTVYFADLDKEGYQEGLQRFADMFRAPSLDKDAIWKEVSAVVSEHSKNVQDPAWFSEGVMLTQADPQSQVGQFHTGDTSTLRNLGKANLSQEIQSYVQHNYCPARMHLVTFSNMPVAAQLQKANETFGTIPRLGESHLCSPEKTLFQDPPPFPQERLQKWLLIEGTQPSATLWMMFPMEDLRKWRESHPTNYVDFALSFPGKNSLVLTLRDQLGLATEVGFSAEHSSAGSLMWITAGLTPQGAHKPQAVMDVIFTFLHHAKVNCSANTISSLAKSARLFWNWPSPTAPSKATSDLAEGMTRLPADELLSSDSLIQQPNATRVLEVLNHLTPANMNVGLVMPDAARIWKQENATVETLPHYNIKYTVNNLSTLAPMWQSWGSTIQTHDGSTNMTATYASLADRLQDENVHNISFQGDLDIALPGSIEGIPEDMSVSDATADRGADMLSNLWGISPELIKGDEMSELWFRQGWAFSKPWVEASMTWRIKKPTSLNLTAHDVVLLQLGMHLLGDELSARLADTGYKGFDCSVSQTHLGVGISVSGFTPLMVNLTDRCLLEFFSALNTENNESLARNIAGMRSSFMDYSDEPIKAAFQDQRILLSPWTFSKSEMYHAISNARPTHADVKHAVENAQEGPFYVTGLIMGNYGRDEAIQLHEKMLNGLGASLGVKSEEVQKISQVVMPKTSVEIRKRNPRHGDENHVTVVTILVGTATVRLRVLLGIVGPIYSQLVFAKLRTEKELGYVVGGEVNEMSTILTIGCYVQGDRQLPDQVEHDCEHVWAKTVPEEIAALDTASFESHKESFKNSLLEAPRTTGQQMDHFEDSILLGDCQNLVGAMLSFLETVNSKEQLLEAWRSVVLPTNGSQVALRKKVIVKLFGNGTAVPTAPSPTHTDDFLANASLDGDIAERMRQERHTIQVLHDSNSSIRQQLVDEGGYFPSELQCTWSSPRASSHQTNSTEPEIVGTGATVVPASMTQNRHAQEVSKKPSTQAAEVSAKGALVRRELHSSLVTLHRGPDAREAVKVAAHAAVKDFDRTHLDVGFQAHRRRVSMRSRPPILRPRPSIRVLSDMATRHRPSHVSSLSRLQSQRSSKLDRLRHDFVSRLRASLD